MRPVAWNRARWTLLEVDRDRALAPWDGVFFELARDRDFRAVGQEPGWQLELRVGSEMRFTYDYGKGSAVTPAAARRVDARTGTRTFHAISEANDLRAEIVPVGCQDSMSGKPYPATVTVTLNDRSFRGCGEASRPVPIGVCSPRQRRGFSCTPCSAAWASRAHFCLSR